MQTYSFEVFLQQNSGHGSLHTVTLGVIIGVIWDCHTFDGGNANYDDGT